MLILAHGADWILEMFQILADFDLWSSKNYRPTGFDHKAMLHSLVLRLRRYSISIYI